jgi:lipoate-protein ligase A
MEPGLLGWELAIDRRTLGVNALPEVTRHICEAAAQGISSLGVDARFRPRNDIEVGGRKISGTGGFFDGDTLFFQGTVLVDMDPGVMMSALRVPRAKLAKRSLDSVEQRVVTLRELLARRRPARDPARAAQGFRRALRGRVERGAADEHWRGAIIARDRHRGVRAETILRTGGFRGWHALVSGGTITSYLRLEGRAQARRPGADHRRFFVAPPRIVSTWRRRCMAHTSRTSARSSSSSSASTLSRP